MIKFEIDSALLQEIESSVCSHSNSYSLDNFLDTYLSIDMSNDMSAITRFLKSNGDNEQYASNTVSLARLIVMLLAKVKFLEVENRRLESDLNFKKDAVQNDIIDINSRLKPVETLLQPSFHTMDRVMALEGLVSQLKSELQEKNTELVQENTRLREMNSL
jgi:cell shape-determining protein MreC